MAIITHYTDITQPTSSMTLYILTLDIDNAGLSSSAHRTREGATQALYEYVKANWDDEMDEPLPKVSAPQDVDTTIEDYFRESLDRAEIEEVELVD